MIKHEGNARIGEDDDSGRANMRDASLGPQGAALILELERLQQAFEIPQAASSRIRRQANETTRIAASPQPKPKRRKSKMARAIDACFEKLGIGNPPAAPANRNDDTRAPPPLPSAPLRNRSPSLASQSRSFVREVQPLVPEGVAQDNKRRGLPAEAPASTAVAAAPHVPVSRALQTVPKKRPQPHLATASELVVRCRDAVTNGVAFLANRSVPAQSDVSTGSLAFGIGRAYDHELRTGLRVLIAAVVLIGGWAALVPLAGAVVVPGNLVLQSSVKSIQHPTGGIVSEIAVHDGMRVNAGDLLVRLDATQARSSLQVVSKQLDDFRARIARLVAERDGLAALQISPAMAARSDEAGVKALLATEESLFRARANARQSQKELLQSRVAQLGEEITGLDAQLRSKAKQLELIAGELTGIQELYDKRLVPLTRLTTLQRESARIDGERGQLLSAIAETKAKIGEAQLQTVRIDQDFRTDVVKELGDAQGKEAELVERGVAARDMLDRIDIRSPVGGLVHQLVTHTVGGVIRTGETIMEIVPDVDDLLIEARLQPNDIDQVRKGQKAFIRFPAFNQRVTPQLIGLVNYISADTSRDQQSSAPYFTVRVSIPDDERRRLGDLQLLSGMPAEVFMQTGSRTMMSYLFKPITDQLQRAFVER